MRINNPKNEDIFAELGVGTTVNGTKAIAEIIDDYMQRNSCRKISSFSSGEFELLEIDINPCCQAIGKKINTLQISDKCKFHMIIRGNEAFNVTENDILEAGDKLIASVEKNHKDLIHKFLQENSEASHAL